MSLGFYFDMSRCVACKSCQVACKDRFGLELAGPITRRVETYEGGTYPNAALYNVSIGCNHCEAPACVENCPTGAMFKSEDGIVLHDDAVCIGCQTCMGVCPYGAPQWADELELIVKCDTCKPLREAGMNPVCVDSCLMRALDFGDMEDLKAKYGSDLVSEVPCLPEAGATTPNLLIKPRKAGLDSTFAVVTM